jgi:hypothetical protein
MESQSHDDTEQRRSNYRLLVLPASPSTQLNKNVENDRDSTRLMIAA